MSAIPEIRKFEQLVNEKLKTNCKYINHFATNLTAPGENYGSIILAVDAQYEENYKDSFLNLVAKLCPPNELLKEAFLCDLTFKKEIQAYLYACPAIENFQKEANIPEKNRLHFFAKCYGARYNLSNNENVDNDAVILLENLKMQKYFVQDRMEGFDLQTTKLILENLAKLHATVIAVRMLNLQEFKNNILPSLKTVDNGEVMIDGFIGTALTFLETIEECKPYWMKIKAMTDERKSMAKGLRFPVKTNLDFYTMVHTDFWTNNIMILKDDTGSPDQVRMVDLQLLDYGSAVRDVLFFIYSSVEIEVFENHFDALFKFYHQCFYNSLKQFKNDNCFLERFTWELFMDEVNDVAPHELFHILFMLKPIFSERGSIHSLESIDIKDFERTDNLGVVYLKKLKQVILSFASKNWLL